jgi:hypothetical protein
LPGRLRQGEGRLPHCRARQIGEAIFNPYLALKRCLEREDRLRWQLKEVLASLDESAIGPATSILPRYQIEQMESAIDNSETETTAIDAALAELDDDAFE